MCIRATVRDPATSDADGHCQQAPITPQAKAEPAGRLVCPLRDCPRMVDLR
jgi:hypothetical protein